MAAVKMEITTAPNETAYDVDHPTRSTELYCNQVHNVLQDLDDSGDWWLKDGFVDDSSRNSLATYIHDVVEKVFDYAEEAINDHRAEEPIGIIKPTENLITKPNMSYYNEMNAERWSSYRAALNVCYFIYYMWKTEEDPLLLKEKLQELLIAWPLHDTTIELADDLGQQFKVYPSWKNADL